MIIYHTGEAFKFKESKVVKNILKITVGVLCIFSFYFLYGSVNETKQLINHLKEKDKVNIFKGYYYLEPNQRFWNEAHDLTSNPNIPNADRMLLAKLIPSWQENSDLKVMLYTTYRYAETEQTLVLTYSVPESYEIEWDGIVLEMAQGEWFQDTEASLIVIKGENRKVGEKVSVKDKEGKEHWIPICGIAKDHYLVETNNFKGIELNNGYEDTLVWNEVYLLNPFCDLNPPDDLRANPFSYGNYKTNDYLLLQKIREYGALKAVSVTDQVHNKINRQELAGNYMEDMPVWMEIADCFLGYHLWYILLFAVLLAALLVLICFMNKWNFGKWLWVYSLLGVWIGNFAVGFHFNTVPFYFHLYVPVIFFLVIFIFDRIVKKNTVHGRTYIVDGWDETDVDI